MKLLLRAVARRARAFAHGNHIWLDAGESAHDHRLLAHEATHIHHWRALHKQHLVKRIPSG
jgi:hypothetical protein